MQFEALLSWVYEKEIMEKYPSTHENFHVLVDHANFMPPQRQQIFYFNNSIFFIHQVTTVKIIGFQNTLQECNGYNWSNSEIDCWMKS